MILADKLIDLRKKAGWSQEELADRLDVSRQSVSKWESAQSVPDMNRVLRLSELFGVTTDYLLKDELGPEALGTQSLPAPDPDLPVRQVSMEDAASFLEYRRMAAKRIALGVMLCILSPILLILLCGAREAGRLALSEPQAVGIGLAVLILMVGGAVALFITTGLRGSRFEYLEKEQIETAYGVDGMAKDRREKYRGSFGVMLTVGIVLCVISVVPIFLTLIFFGDGNGPREAFPHVVSVGLLLALVSVGVYLIVHASIIWGGYQMLLEEGGYSRAAKTENKRNEPLSAVYWCAVTAGYLAWSFLSGSWNRTWIVWPIAGVLFGLLLAVVRALRDKK
ncbi:MAG: helix-turn-helix transcriptional regulator [Oscillospiraceae bacterium]|nr:helix-turn-helix transcriptional regulator [Oscillospiraceae bacterium]